MDNQPIKTTEFVWRRALDPIKLPGLNESLPGWVWYFILGVVLFLGLFYIVWMYFRDSQSVGAWAILLGLFRASVYGILAWVFLLPAYQTWEETKTHSRVLLGLDATGSMVHTRDDPPPDGVAPDKMPTRQDKVIDFLTNPQHNFLPRLIDKNPLVAYRFGRLLDDDFHVFTSEGHWTRKDWEDRSRPPILAEGEKAPPPPPTPTPWGKEQWINWLKPNPGAAAPADLSPQEQEKFDKDQAFLQKLFTGTNLGESLVPVVNREANNMVQALIVFSDGHNTEGSVQKLKELAERCDKAEIPMFIVGIGEDRPRIKIEIADVIAPPQARPEDEFRVRVEVIGEGLANEELKGLKVDVIKPDGTKAGTLEPHEAVKFKHGDTPRATAEFDVKPSMFYPPPPDPKKKAEFAEGVWKFVARVPKDRRESFLKPEHEFDPVEMRVIKRPLRVLLFASGPLKDYHFCRTMMANEAKQGRVELCVYLQPPPGMETPRPGVVQDVPPDHLLTRFPDVLLDEKDTGVKAEDRFYNLGSYDVILAFDPDWSRLTADQMNKVEQWVGKQGGGLVVIAGPINTLTLARPGNDDKYKPILRIYPVIPEDARTMEVDRDLTKKWRLNFPGASPAMEFLQLEEPSDKGGAPTGLTAGWEEFFTGNATGLGDKTVIRGFYSYYPVKKAKDSAMVVATFSDPVAHLSDQSEQPYLVVGKYEAGRVMWIGSGEMWRLRELKEIYLERFWTKVARYAAAGVVNSNNRRIRPFHGRNFTANSTVTIEAQILGRDMNALPQTARPKLTLTVPAGAERDTPTSMEMEPKPSSAQWNGYFQAQFLVRAPGEYKFDLKVPDTGDSIEGRFNVKDFNPETDDTRPDFDTLYWLSSDANGVLARIGDEKDRKEVKAALIASRPKLASAVDKIGRDEVDTKDRKEPKEPKENIRLYFDLKTAHLIPKCMTTVERNLKNRGAINDLWDKGPELALGDAQWLGFKPVWDALSTGDVSQLNRIVGVNLLLLIVNGMLIVATVIIAIMTVMAFQRGRGAEVGFYLLFTGVLLVALLPLQAVLAWLNNPVTLSVVLTLVVMLLAVEWLVRKLLRLA